MQQVVIFWEDTFPAVDTAPLSPQHLAAALARYDVRFVSADDLPGALASLPDLLVLPYGSAFPKVCWPAIETYLRHGGAWVNLGGAPLTRPVRRVGDEWQAEVAQNAYGKATMIRHTFAIPLPEEAQYLLPHPPCAHPALLDNLQPTAAWALQVLLTGHANLSDEVGSSGIRQATLTPLVQALDGERVLAAPVTAIDHTSGAFLGGRWVLASCRTAEPFSPAFIAHLCDYALLPPVQLDVHASFACYQPGELPAIRVRVACPRAVELSLKLTVRAQDSGEEIYNAGYQVTAGLSDAFLTTPPFVAAQPGLYHIQLEASFCGGTVPVAVAENGFWSYDADLLASVAPLTVNEDYFLREGQPFPVTGTTYMSTVSHRTWLFEPSPAAWDRDFAAMRRAGINLVRTGLWMAWKRAMIDIGALDEGMVRALQAFLLCAARHDLPVIFTAFAFLPETWGGKHPYLDPAAVRAQATFLAGLAQRLREMNHLLWDFINEPSFASAAHLWSVRPNNDRAEQAAWVRWLAAQGVSEDEWRERWRLTSSDPLAIPPAADFLASHNLGVDGSHPLRARDFAHFGQEVFARWAATLRDVIRANGNPHQLVTVGQDEGGTMRSPSPHFHGASVDFTSNHSWWQNDDLLWDSVMTKTAARPNLLEETGIMFAERSDDRPWRTLEEVRNLLERKLALSYACGCAGFIQWLWNTCIYNYSDNEAGIGLLRADGSEKPELQALRGVARFMAAHRARMTGRRPERVVVIIPHSNTLSPDNTADGATRRAVRTLEYRLGLPCRAVSEYRPAEIGDADLLVLPSPRILREDCWQALLAKVADGATLLVSGIIEADDYWRPVPRLAPFGLASDTRQVLHEEALQLAENTLLRATFPVKPMEGMLEKAVQADGSPLPLQQWSYGAGRIIYCPLPVEHTLAEEHTETIYRLAADAASLLCGKSTDNDAGPGLLVRPVIFAESTLLLAVNESNIPQTAVLDSAQVTGTPGQWTVTLPTPAARANLAFIDNATGTVLATLHEEAAIH